MIPKFSKYIHPKFKIVADMIHTLYTLDTCRCGGCCHIVTDENNIRNSDQESVIKYCNENTDRIDSELSRTICEIMLQMTIEQRIILFYALDHDLLNDYDYEEFETLLIIDRPENIIGRCIKNSYYNIHEEK